MATKKSQLVELLQCLSSEQRAAFSLFVMAEFHNNGTFRRDVVAMWEIVRANPEWLEDEYNLTGEAFYRAMYPNKPFITGKLDKVASELKSVVRAYLLHEYHSAPQNDLWQQLAWAKVLKKNTLDNQFELQFTKMERTINEQDQTGIDSLMVRFMMELERYGWASSKNLSKTEENLGSLTESFWQCFEAYRLNIANTLLMRNFVVKIDMSAIHIQKTLATHIFPENLKPHFISEISHEILELLLKEQPTKEEFFDLMNLLDSYSEQLDRKLLKDFYTYLRNFCTVLVNTSHPELYQVLYEIQKDNLTRGYYYENGYISAMSMININRVANGVGAVEWALEIVNAHRGRILGDNSEEHFYFINLAQCYFYMGQFEKTLSCLPASCDNVYYYLLSRRLEIMSYYELTSDLTDYKVDAFKMYLRRAHEKFLSKSFYEANIGFANIIQQILLSSPGDNKRVEKLKARLQTKEQVAEQNWLLAKCEELKFISKR